MLADCAGGSNLNPMQYRFMREGNWGERWSNVKKKMQKKEMGHSVWGEHHGMVFKFC